MAIKDTTKVIYNYIKDHSGEDFTAKDIAAALGHENARSVNGSITGMQKKGWVVREEATVENAEGKPEVVKFIRLTDAGKNADLDA